MKTISLPVLSPAPTRADGVETEEQVPWSFRDAGEGAYRVLFPEGNGGQAFLFVADGSRFYQVDAGVAHALDAAPPDMKRTQASALLAAALGIPVYAPITDTAPDAVPLRSLSLSIAQQCNLACSYCFAQEGGFGRQERNMSEEVACAAVDRLLNEAAPGEKIRIAFMGGEPLVNRSVLRETTRYARRQAKLRGVGVGFGITTNGTLITEDDVTFFAEQDFTVTVSIDGVGEVHDSLRPFKGGRGSFTRIVDRLRPLLKAASCSSLEVNARVTVTPRNLNLRETLDALIGMGFHSVGFSPMLSSPTGRDQMGGNELGEMLEQMIACGREYERRLEAGERYPFSNLQTALQEIHRGTHRPYPCGAGGGYMSVSAEGELYACHRFVNDEQGHMGDLERGVDAGRQQAWLKARHVHRQEPCHSCWARYLCGGGCHHEVLHRGRPACDYIRGWLDYCLGAYVRLSGSCVGVFEQ